MKRALITGCTGQDGSYLADLLLEKGYQVYGLVRRTSTDNTWRIKKALSNGLILISGDITDTHSINSAVRSITHYLAPLDECYNLAAQSDVRLSFDQPTVTSLINAEGCRNVLEALRQYSPQCRFYQASTSELFGDATEVPQWEGTEFKPRSPYGIAKLAAHRTTINYREAYGMFTCCGILFNHESPRRGDNFVTQKIVKAAKAIKAGEQDKLVLGNLDSQRDWSHAKDMVNGMWLMLQQDVPTEYVLASGTTHTIKYFLDTVFHSLDLDPEKYIVQDAALFRPAEVNILCGDPRRARLELGWISMYDLDALIVDMIKGEE
jgi:GDPmannose 4,6-dehydratase